MFGTLTSAALGAIAALMLTLAPNDLGMALVGALVCLTIFVIWPWLALPVGIVGGEIASSFLFGRDLRVIIGIHGGILLAGSLAMLIRQLFAPGSEGRIKTRVDLGMLLIGLVALLGAGYGIARGNAPYLTLVAGYAVAVIPAYFFVATYSLNTPARLKRAAIAYVVGGTVLAGASLTTPGQHGGLISALAVVPLLAIGRVASPWRRVGLVVLLAILMADTVLASSRTIWVVTGVALVVLLIRGSPTVRLRVILAATAGALIILGGAAVSSGLGERTGLIAEKIVSSTGVRETESMVGLRAFVDSPLIGQGLGQTATDIFIPMYRVADVGPIYHAFWLIILANLGLVGLVVLLWPLLASIRVGLTSRDGLALSFAALTCGWLVGAAFAGPNDGHWEFGLLPALTFLAWQLSSSQRHAQALGDQQCSPNRLPQHGWRTPTWARQPSSSPTTQPPTSLTV
ncbi:O-antigen ligase family protein [Actinopolymorpha alba]|uniref:O-antigen ligase family protein n=1 Tax=Actinopolymorpha alba TaxID=533267 RepID=UPI0012F69493|nr:O-antigen ligase family protein [Actinopolymorpha alba]